MNKQKMVIGYVPTRRNVFSKEEAQRYKNIIKEHLKNFEAVWIDIDDINEEGLLFDEHSAHCVVQKMKQHKVDGLFFPHCNFGTEFLVGRVAKEMNKPVLLWGPQDDAPQDDGVRTRDSQCGLFATGKALRRFGVPFTYIANCKVTDSKFTSGMETFLAVCRIAKAFTGLRVLQIAPRPAPFWSVICNEGELLEKFGIEIAPLTLSELVARARSLENEDSLEMQRTLEQMNRIDISRLGGLEVQKKIASLKVAMKLYCEELGCASVAMQCWDAMQDETGLMPCFSNGLLTDDGIPVACETDIHGAISAVIMQNAINDIPFFADMTIRHPENANAELLWHCGNFPPSLVDNSETAYVGKHVILPSHCPGTGEFALKQGDITICRFDGDHGEYSLFIGEGKTVDGPRTTGTYVWVEVPDLDLWEKKLVTGPYIHHCSGGYKKVAHILYEACKYLKGLKADMAQPTQEEVENILMKGLRH